MSLDIRQYNLLPVRRDGQVVSGTSTTTGAAGGSSGGSATNSSTLLPVYKDASLMIYYEVSTNSIRINANLYASGEVAAFTSNPDVPDLWSSLRYFRESSIGSGLTWSGGYLTASGSGGSSQWTTISNGLSYSKTGDNFIQVISSDYGRAGIILQRGTSSDAYRDFKLQTYGGELYLNSWTTGVETTILTITDVGNIGIGTTSPTPHYAGRALIIDGTSASTRGMLELWDQAGGKSCMQSVSGTTYLGSLAKGSGTGDVAFTYGAGTIGMTMLGSNGNVGIGIAPGDNQQKLQVHTASDTNLSIRAGSDFGAGYSGSAIDSLNDAITVRKMLILAGNPIVMTGGNVGIGTTSPFTTLVSQTTSAYNLGFGERPNAASRRWWITNDYSAYGDFAICTESSKALANPDLCRFIISPTGNVGIGTTSPQYLLHIYHATTGGTMVIGSGSTGNATLALDSANGDGLGGDYYIIKHKRSGNLLSMGYDGADSLIINSTGNVGIGTTSPDLPLSFAAAHGDKIKLYNGGNEIIGTEDYGLLLKQTSNHASSHISIVGYGGEKVRFDTFTGNVGIGTTSSNNKLQIGSGSNQQYGILVDSYYTSGYAQYVGNWASSGRWGIGPATALTDNTIRIGNVSDAIGTWAGTQNINLVVGGEVTAYYSSDLRLKQNIRQFSALEKIDRMNPVAFQWNAKAKELNSSKDDRTNYGVIAQEIEAVMPELVHKIYEDYKAVDYVQLVPVLIKAIQELQDEIYKIKNNR